MLLGIVLYGMYIIFYTVKVSITGVKHKVKYVWTHVILYYSFISMTAMSAILMP